MNRFCLLTALALLGACNARKPAPEQGFLEPGQWTADLTVDSIDNPDMPPEAIDAYRKRYEIHRSKCITPEDSKTPDRLLFGRPDGCEYSRQQMANGRISATMNCEIPEARQTIQLEGKYERERYRLHVNGMVEDRGQGRTVSYVATLDAKRTGNCSVDASKSGGLVP
ncbi:MAG: DUF3617 domain-containing protein [Sphingomicrobium sp.]